MPSSLHSGRVVDDDLRCFTLVVALLAVAPRPLHAQAQRNTKPFTRFPILLGGILNDTLPFDVTFILWGDIDGRMTKELVRAYVVVWMAELLRAPVPGDASQDIHADRVCRCDEVDGAGLHPAWGDAADRRRRGESPSVRGSDPNA